MVGSYMADFPGVELDPSGLFDRRADAHIGATAANIARHRRIDVGIFGMWRRLEQGCRRHDLPGLAVAALDHLDVQPGLLHPGPDRGGADAFDGRDGALSD